jgi:hypothetical protein
MNKTRVQMETSLSSALAPHGAPATNQAPAATPTSPPPTSRITITLSPSAAPFFPLGRSKAQRWEDSSPSTAGSAEPPSPPPHPSYRDVVVSRPTPVERVSSPAKAKPPPYRALASVVGFCSSLSKTKSDRWHKVEGCRARCWCLLQARAPPALSRGPLRQVLQLPVHRSPCYGLPSSCLLLPLF